VFLLNFFDEVRRKVRASKLRHSPAAGIFAKSFIGNVLAG
jgi:hypothetical protein